MLLKDGNSHGYIADVKVVFVTTESTQLKGHTASVQHSCCLGLPFNPLTS
jgi:hypothetical protein